MSDQKKVAVHLSALTRMYYDCTVTVPANFQDYAWLVDEVYEQVSATDFEDDTDFWEKGECYADQEEAKGVADFAVRGPKLVRAGCPRSPDGVHEADSTTPVLVQQDYYWQLRVACRYCGTYGYVPLQNTLYELDWLPTHETEIQERRDAQEDRSGDD